MAWNFKKWILRIKWTLVMSLSTIGVLTLGVKGKGVLLDTFKWLLSIIGADSESVFYFMVENAQFWGNAAWTLTSLVGAFSIFYYSSLGNRNYGFENRTIIAYIFGGTFVPCLLSIIFLSTLWMSAAYYLEEYTCFFFISLYSILLQMGMILVCIVSTSRWASRMVICREEKKRYHEIYKNPTALSEGMALRTSTVMVNELSDESMQLLKNILKVPYKPLKRTQKEISKSSDNARENESVYYYWYQNFRAIVEAVNERGRITERNRMYTMLYEVLEELWEKEKSGNIGLNRMESLSAVFQTLILCFDSMSKWDAIAYIINHKNLSKRERLLAISVLLASVFYLVNSGQLEIEEEWKREVRQTGENGDGRRAETDTGKLKEMVIGIGRIQLDTKWPLSENNSKMERPTDKMIRAEFEKYLNEIIRVWGARVTEERLKNPLLYENILAGLDEQKIDTTLECLMTGLIQKMSVGRMNR